MPTRPIHPDFRRHLEHKDLPLIGLYMDLREFLLGLYPDANELLYHTHALTSVYSVSEKLGDAYCMIPIYTGHLNLGFNKGTKLQDPHELLQGTGQLIRHIPITKPGDYRNAKVKALVKQAADLALAERKAPTNARGKTVSKIK